MLQPWALADRHRGCHQKNWVKHAAHHLRQVGQECRELAGWMLLRRHSQLQPGGCGLSPLLLIHLATLQGNRLLMRQHEGVAEGLCKTMVQKYPTAAPFKVK